ncbi:hypothetical protein [Nocardia xishanensis]
MYRLRRMYLDSIGITTNRFSDLMAEFTDIDGNPGDSIVWLRNGAGKTTMISLLLALIRPDRRDFLAGQKKNNRTLEDLVLPADTSHVVAEWVGPDGELLMTGAIYEWNNRHRPADYNGRGKNNLKRSWWCLTPDLDVDGGTLDSLPFTRRTEGAYDRARFCSHIQALAGQGLNAVVVHDSITAWHSALRERRFDPGLFDYFLVVNSAEGGMDKMFENIDSPGRFVQYLLRFVVNHERMQEVRNMLKNNAAEVAKRPLYEDEKEFCDQAQARLHTLDAVCCDLRAAKETLAGERHRAAVYRRALQTAVKVAEMSAGSAGTTQASIEEELTAIRSEVDMQRARAAHYRFRGAEFALAASEAALEAAKTADTHAKNTVAAWQAVECYLDLQRSLTEFDLAKAALAEKTEKARPLQDRLEAARAELAGALSREVELVDAHIQELDELKRQCGEAIKAADGRVEDAQGRRADLRSEQDTIHKALSSFEDKLERQTRRGCPTPGETLHAAVQRLKSEIGQIDTRRAQLLRQQESNEHEFDKANGIWERARAAAADTERTHTLMLAQRDQLARRAGTLADNPRLRTLLQAEAVDLLREAGDAIKALEQAKSNGEQRMFELKESIAAGDRALHALNTDALLPPRLQVQRILDELNNAGVTAFSGWQYLAKNVPTDQHRWIIAELPAVADGIVVYDDDLAAVAAKVTGLVEDIVVIAPAKVFEGHPEAQFVLGPANAQHDHAAAEEELRTRAAAHQQTCKHLGEIERQWRDDDELLSKVRALVAELPGDGWETLEAEVARTGEALRAAQDKESATKSHSASLQTEIKQVSKELGALAERLARAEPTLQVIDDLRVEEVDVVVPSRRRLQKIPAEIAAADDDFERARLERSAATAQLTATGTQLEQAKTRRGDWRASLQALPAPAPTTLPLQTAREAVEFAETQLRERFPEDTLRGQVATAEQNVREVAKRWESKTSDDQIHQLAMELVASPDAAEPASRRAAEHRAADVAADATQKLAQTRTERDGARRTRDQAREEATAASRRSRKDEDRTEPTDAAHAHTLAEEAERIQAELEARRWQHEQERDAQQKIQARENARAQLITDQSDRLRQVEPADSDSGEVIVPPDDDALRAAVKGLVDDLDTAGNLVSTTQHAFDNCADDLSSWAGSDRFIKVADDEDGQAVRQVREMLRDRAGIARAADNAATLAEELRLRSARIAAQIEAVEEAREIIVARMTDRVADALSVLGRASTLSELPEGIGTWDHKRFLDVAPKAHPSREQIALRIGDLVDRMVNSKTVEYEPVELVWLATEAAVPEGFRATVLKPDPEQPTNRVPVTDMQKWSGGENLTASLVLFCVLARLRTEQRTDKGAAVGGLLPLDNPISRASLRQFVELQRKVARANGVQLVFWTGLGDLAAISAFPRTVAMHKRSASARSDRAYVVLDEEHSARMEIDAVTAVRREP